MTAAPTTAKEAVLVTGASSGIGRATALRLAANGTPIWAGIRSDADAQELDELGERLLMPLSLDVTDTASIESARETVRARGRLRAVVNNAGQPVPGPLELLTADELRHQLDVNLVGQLEVTRIMLPLLRESDAPRIVFVSSVGGKAAFPFAGAYHASKFGLEAAAEALRKELRDEGVHVILIEPGPLSTEIWAKAESRLAGLRARERAEIYATRLDEFEKLLASLDERGDSAYDAAEVIEGALTESSPSTRYPVGRGARLLTKLRPLIPDRLFDLLANRPLRS